MMKILSKMETGQGGNWVLVDYGNNFYAYGFEQDLYSLLGFPVDNCGTKDEVISRCNSIANLCKKDIEKAKHKGWTAIIKEETKELEMLIEFSRILKLQ